MCISKTAILKNWEGNILKNLLTGSTPFLLTVLLSNSSIYLQAFGNKASFFELKFIYSEKATKFCKISTLLLSVCILNKSKMEVSQNFVVFSQSYFLQPDMKKISELF